MKKKPPRSNLKWILSNQVLLRKEKKQTKMSLRVQSDRLDAREVSPQADFQDPFETLGIIVKSGTFETGDHFADRNRVVVGIRCVPFPLVKSLPFIHPISLECFYFKWGLYSYTSWDHDEGKKTMERYWLVSHLTPMPQLSIPHTSQQLLTSSSTVPLELSLPTTEEQQHPWNPLTTIPNNQKKVKEREGRGEGSYKTWVFRRVVRFVWLRHISRIRTWMLLQ
jgi:hypothetical protein